MSSNLTALLPNPLTPLAWLPPDIAHQEEIARSVIAAIVGAWLWDFAMSFVEDLRMFLSHRFRAPDMVYILSRCLSFAFILQSLIFIVGPVASCQPLALSIGWTGALAMPLNSLLFFFRIQAVFHKLTRFVFIYAFLWLCTLTTITAPFAIDHAINIGTPAICVETDVKGFANVGPVLIAVHDSLVYIGISARLTLNNLPLTSPRPIDALKIFFSGKGIGQISKSLLTTGQMYYFATIGMSIAHIAVIFSPSVPPVIKATIPIPNIALQNVMACRVYRQLKLGLISETSTTTLVSASSSSRSTPPASAQLQKRKIASNHPIQFKCSACRGNAVDPFSFTSSETGGVKDGYTKRYEGPGVGVVAFGGESHEDMEMKGMGIV